MCAEAESRPDGLFPNPIRFPSARRLSWRACTRLDAIRAQNAECASRWRKSAQGRMVRHRARHPCGSPVELASQPCAFWVKPGAALPAEERLRLGSRRSEKATALDPKRAYCDLQLASVVWLTDRAILMFGVDRMRLPHRLSRAARPASPAPRAASRLPRACGTLRRSSLRDASTSRFTRSGSAAAPRAVAGAS